MFQKKKVIESINYHILVICEWSKHKYNDLFGGDDKHFVIECPLVIVRGG